MLFDMPVLAFSSSAIPETIADAGVIFNDKSELAKVAALALKVATDKSTRNSIFHSQRQRRLNFLPRFIILQFLGLVKKLGA